jgi:hypothetical protein
LPRRKESVFKLRKAFTLFSSLFGLDRWGHHTFANEVDINAPLYRGYGCLTNYAGLEEVKIRKEF